VPGFFLPTAKFPPFFCCCFTRKMHAEDPYSPPTVDHLRPHPSLLLFFFSEFRLPTFPKGLFNPFPKRVSPPAAQPQALIPARCPNDLECPLHPTTTFPFSFSKPGFFPPRSVSIFAVQCPRRPSKIFRQRATRFILFFPFLTFLSSLPPPH